MNQLLIVLVLAVLSMTEGLEITDLYACTNKTNDLRIDCAYKKTGSNAIQYEWSLSKEKSTFVLASTIHTNAITTIYKDRAKAILKDTCLTLMLTGFSDSDDGTYTCHLHSDSETKKNANKTISVKHGNVTTCGAPGLVLDSPRMLILLLSLAILHALDALPCGSQN
ncbi:thy-1 membrane glycoprotein [Rhincodon typus]|uniref:thy-1 membrane glycoprotein n=1 Tax=Rhincodon typus TaxID=259920 RepID=UPI00202DF33C|nr:thy-1 membrane glycoprotein [Rhincodon typus]XP_048471345.1 thy-1 membrane glycoprotein [Rhincodon typus]XP_048471346.1 thy-1 membrane glycoprotein [Rhincodon typus]